MNKVERFRQITNEMLMLYERITNDNLLIRRITMVANNVVDENQANKKPVYQQFDLFTDYYEQEEKIEKQKEDEIIDKKIQKVMLDIKKKYGKNSILKAMNYEEGGTTIDRNKQIGGHKE